MLDCWRMLTLHKYVFYSCMFPVDVIIAPQDVLTTFPVTIVHTCDDL